MTQETALELHISVAFYRKLHTFEVVLNEKEVSVVQLQQIIGDLQREVAAQHGVFLYIFLFLLSFLLFLIHYCLCRAYSFFYS